MTTLSLARSETGDINPSRGQLGIGWSGVAITGNLWDLQFGGNHYCISSAGNINMTLPSVGTAANQAQPGYWCTILNTNPFTNLPGNNIVIHNDVAFHITNLVPGTAVKLIACDTNPNDWCVEYDTAGMFKASLRANVDPTSNPDPITNGLIIPALTPEFNMPITVIPQGLSIGDGFLIDPANVFTINPTTIDINVLGHYRVSLNGYLIGSVDNESKIMQVIEDMFPIFAGPPGCVDASAYGTPITVPLVGVVWTLSSTSDILVTTVPTTIALKCLFTNPTSDVVISLTSNMSINQL